MGGQVDGETAAIITFKDGFKNVDMDGFFEDDLPWFFMKACAAITENRRYFAATFHGLSRPGTMAVVIMFELLIRLDCAIKNIYQPIKFIKKT